jgi:uncharacterized membrane protein
MEQAKQVFSAARVPIKWGIVLACSLLFIGWLLNTPSGLLGKADAVGYAVCHRIDLRSFHLLDRPTPLCARCTGQYLGAVLGLFFLSIVSPRRIGTPPKWVIAIMIGFVVVFIIDGLNSYFHLPPMLEMLPNVPRLYEPNNTLRLFTGTGLGLAIAAALYPAFNYTIWQDVDRRSTIPNLRVFVLMLILAVVMDLLVLSEILVILYPLALVSAAGVVILLTMIYTMVWVMVFKVDHRFTKFTQLALPMIGGFTLAILQIALLDVGRYLLTGTWEGFHIG